MNKKGFELIELMVVIVIIGILAAVAIPKFFSLYCRNDMKKCKADDYELYQSQCVIHPDECLSKEDLKSAVIDYCGEHENRCYGKNGRVNATKITSILEGDKEQPAPEVKHDTVYVVKYDTVYKDMTMDKCIEKCKDENKSESLVKFCVKEKCVD